MGTKLKLTESQFDKALYAALSESPLLVEADMSKSEVETIAKKAIKNYFDVGRSPELENKVKTIVRQMMKTDSAMQNAVVEISKNVLIQLYKALWTKKVFGRVI